MVCEVCKKGKIVLWAFSNGECEVCKEEVWTSHIPCDRLCEECSEKEKRCKECGCEIE